MFIVALSARVKKGIKKNKIRPLAATWKNPENVIPNEVIHREGKILLCFSFSEINNCRYHQLPPSNNHSPEVCVYYSNFF